MMNDKNGCSTCPNGQEQYENFTMNSKKYIQYDYRDENGKLFSCVKPTLEACRTARYAWIAKQKTEQERFTMISRCLDRYERLIAQSKDRMQAFMDIDFSHVNVWSLINFDNANFEHDMNGIFRHIDRENKCLKDGFIPRAGIIKQEN